jgi:O-antigen ligase
MLKQLISREGFLAVVYVLLLLGMTVPYGFPVFSPIIFLCFVTFLIRRNFLIYFNVFNNYGILLLYLCILFYLIGIAMNDGIIYKTNIRDVKNILPLVVISLMLGNFTSEKYKKFISIYHLLIIPVISAVAILCLVNFHLLVTGGTVLFVDMETALWATGTSLSSSYNMFALGMFAGLLAALSSLKECEKFWCKTIVIFFISVIGLTIIFSGSRRAWIVLAILGIYGLGKVIRGVFSYVFSGILGRFEVRKISTAIAFAVLVFALVWVGSWYKRTMEFERMYEFGRLKYRLETIFDEEGIFTKAFSKRTSLWSYGFDLIDDFNWSEIFWGRGFDYLNSYGLAFGDDEREGGPHNFIISSVLYSGLIGTSFLLLLIILSFYKLWIDRRIYGKEFILLYLISLAFIGIGATSIFSMRILPVIILTIFSVNSERITVSHKDSSLN